MGYFSRCILILIISNYIRGGDALEVRNISVCYGVTLNNFKSINCEESEVILVRSVMAMAKPSSAQCPHTETTSDPAAENCCRYEENDCGGEYTGAVFKSYYDRCHGKQQCLQLQASWEPTEEKFPHCNRSMYPEETNYMIFEYSCVPLSYTNSPCSSTAVMGESVFLWNEGYPDPMPPSDTCSCSIEALCDSPIAVTAIDLRLNNTQDGCQQHFVISNDSQTTSVNCDDNNDFRPITVFTSNIYFATITFTNDMQIESGLFWIEISGLESAEFSLRCGTEIHTSISSQEKETCGISSTTVGPNSTGPSGSNSTDTGGNSTLGNGTETNSENSTTNGNTTTDNGNSDQGNSTLDNTNGVNNDTDGGNGTINDGSTGNGTNVDGSENGENNNDTNGSENGNGNSTNIDDTDNGSGNSSNVNGTTDSTLNYTTAGNSDSTDNSMDGSTESGNGTNTNDNSGTNSGNGSNTGTGNTNGNDTYTHGDNDGSNNGSIGNNSSSDGANNNSDSGNMQSNGTSTGDQGGDDNVTDATGGTSPNTAESKSSDSSIVPIIAGIAVVVILLVVGALLFWKRRPIKEKLCPSQVNEKQNIDNEACYDDQTNPLFNSGAFVLITSVAAKNTAYPEKHGRKPLIEPTTLDKSVPNGRLSPIAVPKIPPTHLPPIKSSKVEVFTQKSLPRLGLMSLILNEHEANPLPSIGQYQNGSVRQGGDFMDTINTKEEQKQKSSKKKKNKLLKKLKKRKNMP